MIEIVWEYVVRADSVAAFREAYGSNGSWAALFRKHAGYMGTRLFQDVASEGRFLTVDSWESQESFEEMCRTSKREYDELDAASAALTVSERKVGVLTERD